MTTIAARKRRPERRKRGRRQHPIATEAGLSGLARDYLFREVSVFEEATDEAIADWVRELLGATTAGRTERLRRFTIAYALWLDYGGRGFLSSLTGTPFHQLQPKQGPEVFLKLLVPYQSGNDEKARQARRRQISRDVCAIRYLAESGVPPQEVASLAEVKGEGLDAWSRKASRRLPTPAPEENDDVALSTGGSNTVDADTFVTITHPASGGEIKWAISDKKLVRDVMTYMKELGEQHPDAVAIGSPHQRDDEEAEEEDLAVEDAFRNRRLRRRKYPR